VTIIGAPLLNGEYVGQPALQGLDAQPSLGAIQGTVMLSGLVPISTAVPAFTPSLDFSDPRNSQYIPGML